MSDRFGKYNTAGDINAAARELLTLGDEEGIIELAREKGLDPEDAQDYIESQGEIPLTNELLAAYGKLNVEEKELNLKGIVSDWKKFIEEECLENKKIQNAIVREDKNLAEVMAKLIAFSFENKVQISDKIVDITMVNHNGKMEKMRKPLYLGIPNRAEVKKIAREYYLG